MGLKDNLFNLVLAEGGEAPFGGCTGNGCGAAFNFVTLLSDGGGARLQKISIPPGEYPSRFSKRDLRLGSRVEDTGADPRAACNAP